MRATFTSDDIDAIETAERFSTPLELPSEKSFLGLSKRVDVVRPKVERVRNGKPDKFKGGVRSFSDLLYAALGGDVEYTHGDTLQMLWSNDGIRLSLSNLTPVICHDTKIVFRGTMRLQNLRRTVIEDSFEWVTFLPDEDLAVPQEIIKLLQMHRRKNKKVSYP